MHPLKQSLAPSAAGGLVLALLLLGVSGSWAAENEFPFDRELMLETKPMPGSKRVPMLEVAASGFVMIDLWCNSVEGQIVLIDNNNIAVLTGAKTNRPCTPERERGDQEVLSSLTQVTKWRREGDAVVLIGPRPLRFRLATH